MSNLGICKSHGFVEFWTGRLTDSSSSAVAIILPAFNIGLETRFPNLATIASISELQSDSHPSDDPSSKVEDKIEDESSNLICLSIQKFFLRYTFFN